jgi:hypothetical protein
MEVEWNGGLGRILGSPSTLLLYLHASTAPATFCLPGWLSTLRCRRCLTFVSQLIVFNGFKAHHQGIIIFSHRQQGALQQLQVVGLVGSLFRPLFRCCYQYSIVTSSSSSVFVSKPLLVRTLACCHHLSFHDVLYALAADPSSSTTVATSAVAFHTSRRSFSLFRFIVGVFGGLASPHPLTCHR